MTIKVLDTGTIIATGTTETGTIGSLHGTIKKIEIVDSASSDFWIFSDASDEDTSLVDEDILGTTGSKITVNTTLISYPVVAQKTGANNTATDPDQYAEMIVKGRLEYSIASIAAADTFRIMVYYEPLSGD